MAKTHEPGIDQHIETIYRNCPLCGEQFKNKRDEFLHLQRWGCPLANRVYKQLAAPLCKCGCNLKVESSKRSPAVFNAYIHGHNKKIKRGQT